jgi:hypothetical protein
VTVLMEPPQAVVWAEQAGPMSWIEPGPEPPPIDWPDPDLETQWWLGELEAAWAPQLATREAGWAVPGVWKEPDPLPRPEPSGDVKALAGAARRLAATDPTTLLPEQALVDLEALMRADELLRIARLNRWVDAHTRKLHRLDGEPGMNSWVRRRFDDAPWADIPVADNLRPYVHLRSEVSARRVSVEAAGLIGKALKKLRPHLDRDTGLIDGQPGDEVIAAVVGNVVPLVAGARLGLKDDDPLLLELLAKVEEVVAGPDSQLGKLEVAFILMGVHIPLRYLKAALDEQVDALLPSELEERAAKGQQTRNLRLDKNRAYGGGRISVEASDELYEYAEALLAAEVRRDPENPADTLAKTHQRTIHGEVVEPDDVEADGDVRFPRTRGQRLHDALLLMFQRYAAAGLAGSHDKAPVSITVTVSSENVERQPGALPAKGGSGRSLPASLVGRWWCDASVTALVVSTGLIPLGSTHEQRTLTAIERKASKVQHGHGCSGLRCCIPHDPLVTLVPHHVRSWAKFGKTSIEETIWAGPRLHDAIHRGKTVPLRNSRWLDQHGWAEPPVVVDY